MLLNTTNAEACRRLIAGNQSAKVSLSRFTGFTLAGVMELLLSSSARGGSLLLLQEMQSSATESHPVITPLMREWNRKTERHCSIDIHGTRTIEFFRVRYVDSILGTEFQLFQERMSRSMRQAGFGKEFALALMKVFYEMTDNVGQHSRLLGNSEELTGLVGYHVEDGYAAFCVADIGIGALASLASAHKWKNLKSASEALKAIIVDHASRRDGQDEGEGFKQVLRALTDRNTLVRLRSDDAAVLLEPRDLQRLAGFVSSPPLQGMQVNLACDLRDTPHEKEIVLLPT